MRFVDITESPPGFYIDEAAISAQVICVRQAGQNLQGQKWPLFTEVLGGGYATPAYLYPAAVWTSLFGDSIASFRSFAAFSSVLFIFGSFVFARRFWRTPEAAYLCALAAAISPWVFQFARIAWDPALAPAYLVWAFALLWTQGRFRIFELALSGLLFSLASYVYPPLRVQIAIILPFAVVGLVFVWKRDWKQYLLPAAVAFVASLPLIALTLSGEIQARFQKLSVFNPDYLLQAFGSTSFINGLRAVFANLEVHFSPSYLFMRGDANLRHSTGGFGIWSWLDDLGLLTALGTFLLIISGRAKMNVAKFAVSFVIAGYLAGLLPAAMTGESNPHALRSFGAVVFLVLGVGGGLSLLWRISWWTRSAVVGTACAYFLVFVHFYFIEYPKIAGPWFGTEITDLAQQLSSENRILEMNDILKARDVAYASMAINYYQLADGALRCPLQSDTESR